MGDSLSSVILSWYRGYTRLYRVYKVYGFTKEYTVYPGVYRVHVLHVLQEQRDFSVQKQI